MTKAYREWCARVKRLMAEKQITQQELARKSLVSAMTIKKIIAVRGEVFAAIIANISRALDIPEKEYTELVHANRKAKRRKQELIDLHMAKHANCAKCGGAGEIADTEAGDGGTRLCPGEVKSGENVSRNTKKNRVV
jgi:transcriptional regulator with XRE-family HTH domain